MKSLAFVLFFLVLILGFVSCDRNEYSPDIEDQEFTVVENSPAGTLVGTIEASDNDEGQTLGFEIIDGNEDGVFRLDYSSGRLSVDDSEKLDYEEAEQFLLTISVSDNHDSNPLESTAAIMVDIQNINEIPHNGLQTYYSCSSNTVDSSGNGYHLTNPGLLYGVDRRSVNGETFNFSGSQGLYLLSQIFNNQSEPQSVSLWFKTESLNNVDYGGLMFGVLGRDEAGSGSRFILSMKNGIIQGGYGDEWADDNKWNENLESSSTINDNLWHHLVFISNGDNQEAVLIIDNEVVDSRVLSKSNHSKTDNLDLKIGGDKNENYFTGELDELLYYHRALTIEETTAIFMEKWN